jgi:hypothetical protein
MVSRAIEAVSIMELDAQQTLIMLLQLLDGGKREVLNTSSSETHGEVLGERLVT